MMVMVPRQYFHHVGPAVQLNPGNIIFASCRSISCVFIRSNHCSAIMVVEFAVFLLHMKSFKVLAIYCSRAYGIFNR